MSTCFENYWGIDVSKGWLDIAIDKVVTRIEQTEEAINGFINQQKAFTSKALVTLESTGGYEKLVADCLSLAGLTVHIAHPNKVKSFAKAKGRLAKTDKIDAKLLCDYGRFIDADEIRGLRSKEQEELRELGARLAQLKDLHHQETCRLGIASNKNIARSHGSILKTIKAEIAVIVKQIMQLINENSGLKEKHSLLCSMKGVGPVLSMVLLTDLPELGQINKKEVAALVGVAPLTNQSGQKTGKAMTKYGRAGIRKILYMAALTASRHNPKLKVFYERLVSAGKPRKVAIVAVMRKMLVILNAMIITNTRFEC
jgi:transposase